MACMESSAQDAALVLLAAFSIRVLRLLAVLGDTIRFPLLVSRVERNGSPLAEYLDRDDADAARVPTWA